MPKGAIQHPGIQFKECSNILLSTMCRQCEVIEKHIISARSVNKCPNSLKVGPQRENVWLFVNVCITKT